DLRRLLSKRVVPVALPGSDAGGGTATAIGPVVPLDANAGEGDELLGAGGGPAPAMSDPIATRVMSRGAAIATPVGRADDFSWPRPGASASAAPEIAPQPAALTPAPAGKSDKKPADSAKDAKSKPGKESAKDSGVTRPRRPANADLDGAPIPPAPVGSR
ncbi:MAG: hypothetical protein WAR76_24940, partial [Xanthobacteraceae bacterium]